MYHTPGHFCKSDTGGVVHHYSCHTLVQFDESYTLAHFDKNYTLVQFDEKYTLVQFDQPICFSN